LWGEQLPLLVMLRPPPAINEKDLGHGRRRRPDVASRLSVTSIDLGSVVGLPGD
jgi:hypothetical protein